MTKIININGMIVSDQHKEIYDDWEIENTAPRDILEKLPSNGKDPIEIHISSGGGDVYAGFLIYSKLKDYKGRKTVKILNLAASAASIIAMVGDEILISPVAQIMIHNASVSGASGNQHEIRKLVGTLEELAESLINAYELRTGQSREQLQKWMDEEIYFSAQKAVEYGFADEIMFTTSRTQNKVIAACINTQGLLSASVIDEYFVSKKEKEEKATKHREKARRLIGFF